jgi:hypothetical protein
LMGGQGGVRNTSRKFPIGLPPLPIPLPRGEGGMILRYALVLSGNCLLRHDDGVASLQDDVLLQMLPLLDFRILEGYRLQFPVHPAQDFNFVQ